jgi:hypothetical protein
MDIRSTVPPAAPKAPWTPPTVVRVPIVTHTQKLASSAWSASDDRSPFDDTVS